MPSHPAPLDSPSADAISAPALRRNGRYAHDPVSLGLRKLWQDVENEPVPAAFLALLDAIDAARSAGSPQSDDGAEA